MLDNPDTFARDFFRGYCPYTGTQCVDWNCSECEVEAEEDKWLEELDEEEETEI